MTKQRNAMFPGSFDPIHSGHINIIKRCSKLFDKVYVAVSSNWYKKGASSLMTRFEKTKLEINKLHLKNVEVVVNKGLTVDFAKKHNVSFIIRSIRDSKDAKYEIDMAQVNHYLDNKIETILMLPQHELVNLSSTAIRQLNDVKKAK